MSIGQGFSVFDPNPLIVAAYDTTFFAHLPRETFSRSRIRVGMAHEIQQRSDIPPFRFDTFTA